MLTVYVVPHAGNGSNDPIDLELIQYAQRLAEHAPRAVLNLGDPVANSLALHLALLQKYNVEESRPVGERHPYVAKTNLLPFMAVHEVDPANPKDWASTPANRGGVVYRVTTDTQGEQFLLVQLNAPD